ncbi:MAG: hypothetical protein LUG66_06140 [Clostridiales bacterium]|nr:hypothetical protein [Clostridiales bacterium]
MKCLLCGTDCRKNERRCPNCGTSVRLMEKLKRLSNRYYNRAIDRVKASNLTDARESLETALLFNKRNINAQNLLGLVCLETGEVGEAFKHWLLSVSYQKTNNRASEYISYTEANIVEFDKMDMGIKLYNEALALLKGFDTRTADPDKIRRRLENALNKLKGAVDFNPKLLKAVNLMTLCYIILGERIKALDLAKSVLYADVANPEAAMHFNILCPDRTRPPVKVTGEIEKKPPKNTEAQATPIENQGFFTSSMFLEAAAFILGILACTAVFMFLIIPGITEEQSAKIEQLQQQEETIASVPSGTAAEIVSSVQTNDTAQKEADIAKAKQLFDSYYYIDACELLADLDTKGISAESKAVYDSIIDDVLRNGSAALLDLGQRAYNEGETENAKSFLTKALTYSENASEEDEELLKTKYTAEFYLARIAMDKGETLEAATLFNNVKTNHPDKKYQNYAESYLSGLKED